LRYRDAFRRYSRACQHWSTMRQLQDEPALPPAITCRYGWVVRSHSMPRSTRTHDGAGTPNGFLVARLVRNQGDNFMTTATKTEGTGAIDLSAVEDLDGITVLRGGGRR